MSFTQNIADTATVAKDTEVTALQRRIATQTMAQAGTGSKAQADAKAFIAEVTDLTLNQVEKLLASTSRTITLTVTATVPNYSPASFSDYDAKAQARGALAKFHGTTGLEVTSVTLKATK